MKLSALRTLAAAGGIAVALLAAARINAQNLTLEGQTGGFITPTAYVVLSEKGHLWSHPAVGYHFVNASSVIGYVHSFPSKRASRTALNLDIRAAFIPRETAPHSAGSGISQE